LLTPSSSVYVRIHVSSLKIISAQFLGGTIAVRAGMEINFRVVPPEQRHQLVEKVFRENEPETRIEIDP
jgi:acetylornithine deacetylase/succinyl-diaminopimelate desuccinylase-like protein